LDTKHISTLTTILESDKISDSRAVINTNFSNLNTDKEEVSNKDTNTSLGTSDTKYPSQNAVKAYVDENKGGGMNNLIKNGNFINNSTNGYGGTPDDWTSSNANPVQGGFPSMTKQELIDLLGITDEDIEGLWNLNEASGDAIDLSSNGYDLTDTNTVGASEDGLMGKARDFEADNSEYFQIANASSPNLDIAGNSTFFAFVKPESLSESSVVSKRITGHAKDLKIYATGKFAYIHNGTSIGQVISDITPEVGKWYLIVGITDVSNTKLKIWVNGIKKESAYTGTADTSIASPFTIGRLGDFDGQYFDGLIQNAGVLSVALTDSQVKKLFAATSYRGMKIRRATDNASLTQALPEDLVERLRGKDISIVAKAYQTVASTMQVSINDGTETASETNTTVDAWQNIGVTKTISDTAQSITLALKHSTTDGNTWFKEVSVYEGSSLVYVWYPSYDDIARFPRLLKMDIPAIISGYQFEEKKWFDWTPILSYYGSMTASSVTIQKAKFFIDGKYANAELSVDQTFGGTLSFSWYASSPFSKSSSELNDTPNVGYFLFNNSVQDIGICRFNTLGFQFMKRDASNFHNSASTTRASLVSILLD